ncbi:MAG: hypothetical protein D6797_05700, partial [Bdellovibrio sp.]
MIIESLKARWAVIIIVLVVAILWNVPNFMNVDPEKWFTKDKLRYGLDIQGGLHLVMGVDVEGVVREKIAREVKNIKEELKKKNIAFQSVEVSSKDPTQIHIMESSADSAKTIKEFIEKNYAGVLQVLEQEGNALDVRYYDSRIRQ